MKIKICPYCGSHNLDSSTFCGSCGGALSANAVELDASAVHLGLSDTGQNPSAAANPTPDESVPPETPPATQPPLSSAPQATPPSPGSSHEVIPQPSDQYTSSPMDSSSKTTCSRWAGGCVVALVVIAALVAIIAGLSSGSIRDGVNNTFSTFFASLGGGLGIILLLGCSFGPFIFWIWTLIDCLQNEPSASNDKIIWLLVIFFTNFIGALLYIVMRKPERKRLYGR